MQGTAIYPGTFDPITLGHLDLVQRASKIFSRVILAFATEGKSTMFSLDERMAMARESLPGVENVEIESFDGLLMKYARERGVHVIVRGIRAYSDFEFEFQMALTNRKLAPDVETMFLMPNEAYGYLSSSLVREVAKLGGDTSDFVSGPVQQRLDRLGAG
ncbi:MAG: pantetheine-phosphate adenylyltransferase [Verrucomicrobia bacterium]|nr:pantetheine-phosphate adenylyltransferase [Verrucomicrobiota bacterium]MDA1086728.1 pantetheine-phosphate adenylyltransferase [Verrucomicrobiota bacterium]